MKDSCRTRRRRCSLPDEYEKPPHFHEFVANSLSSPARDPDEQGMHVSMAVFADSSEAQGQILNCLGLRDAVFTHCQLCVAFSRWAAFHRFSTWYFRSPFRKSSPRFADGRDGLRTVVCIGESTKGLLCAHKRQKRLFWCSTGRLKESQIGRI